MCFQPRLVQSTIKEIDEAISDLTQADPELRMSADTALERLGNIVNAMSPGSLLIEPQVIKAEK
jgi:hypothetical protein